MSKKWLFFLVLLISVSSVNAQLRKIPAAVTDAFKVKYADATKVEWVDKLSSFEAEFTVEEKVMRASFSSKGEWIKTESKGTFAGLPPEVKEGFKKSKYADLSVLEVLQIEDNKKGEQFKVIVKKNDYSKRNLVFTKTGQLVSDNSSL